jgi:hypothetical protein
MPLAASGRSIAVVLMTTPLYGHNRIVVIDVI